MKKFFTKILILLFLNSCIFADWFDDRYFEFFIDIPFGFSNNTLAANSILTKNPVIDFKEISDTMPKKGFETNGYSNINWGFNLNLRKVEIGARTGVDVWGNTVLSKDLFEYLGEGNALGETVKISQQVDMDVFAYQEFSVGFNVKKFKVTVRPAFFLPILHIGANDGSLSITNQSDGSLIVNYESEMKIYSAFDFNGGDFNAMPGFDLAASVSYPLFDFLTLTGNLRIPLVPGQLGYSVTQTTTMNFSTSVDKIVNGDMGSPELDTSLGSTKSSSYKIHRPLKTSIFADFTPFGEGVILTGGLGLGFRHSFTSDSDTFDFFGEYYIGGKLVFKNILSAGFSTQYYEKVFIHQLDLRANVRVFELDFGISSQSTGFLRSFSGGGLGTYITMKFGY